MKKLILFFYSVSGFAVCCFAGGPLSADVSSVRSIALSGDVSKIGAAADTIAAFWPNDVERYSKCSYTLVMSIPVNKHPELWGGPRFRTSRS